VKLEYVPRGLEELIQYYGDPRGENGEVDHAWYEKNTDVFQLPFPMRTYSHHHVTTFRAHVLVGPVIEACMAEIASRLSAAWMAHHGWDFWGGCYYYRPMRKYQALSTHAWGIAVDLNPERAPQGGKPGDQHQTIVRVFESAGFRWGGRWGAPYICDPMHFQAARNY